MRESQIKKKVIEHAKKLGLLTYQFVSPSNKGVPDRLFILPNGVTFFIEFKSSLGKISKLQEKTIATMRAHNAKVFIVADIESGIELIDSLNAQRI